MTRLAIRHLQTTSASIAVLILVTVFAAAPHAWAEVGVISDRGDLLRGEDAAGQIGDLVLRGASAEFIFSAADHGKYRLPFGGALIDASLTQTRVDRLGELRTAFGPTLSSVAEPTATRLGEDGESVVVVGIDPENSEITLVTEYRLDPDWPGLIVTTELTNGTEETLEGWQIGDQAHWGSTMLFLMNRGVAFRPGIATSTPCVITYGQDFGFAFLAEGDGEVSITTHRDVSRLSVFQGDIASGETVSCTRRVLVGLEDMASMAEAIWSIRGMETGLLRGEVLEQGTNEPVVGAEVLINERIPAAPRPILRAMTDETGQFTVPLPAGITVMGIPRAHSRTAPTQTVFPAEITAGGEALQQYLLSAPAEIDVRVTDEETGELLPVRIALYSPQGAPADLGPVQSGEIGGPYIYAATGQGIYQVPPGQYEMTISHGPEYSRFSNRVIFVSGMRRQFHLTLDRLIETPGWVAADLGVLTSASQDSLVSAADRVRTGVCEGLEFMVSTDSQQVTDLSAALEAEGLGFPVTLAMGERIHAPVDSGMGSWTVFPIPDTMRGQSALGGIEASSTAGLLAQIRERLPEALITAIEPLAIGESPFLEWGYDYQRVERQYFTDTVPSAEQMDFDLFEVMGNQSVAETRSRMALFHSLVRDGFHPVAVASANSHYAGLEEIGIPRTYIAADDSDPGAIDPEEVWESLRSGNAFITTGPFLEFTIFDQPMGSTILWEMGEEVMIDLRVACPGWMTLSYVDVLKEGLFVQRQTFLRSPGDLVHEWEPSPDQQRFMARNDHFISVEVSGRSAIEPLSPANGNDTPVVSWALANPIIIDTDGNGRFDFVAR